MRQGITTRYLGPTNSKGSRIKATARKANPRNDWPEMSLTRSYQYDSSEVEHAKAAQALATKLGWSGLWIAGGKPEEDGNMYVNARETCPNIRNVIALRAFGVEGADWFIVDKAVEA